MSLRGIDALLQMLGDAGVRYLFGNPGTTELPLSDALVGHPEIRYVLGLQEVPVLAMAGGYAQASRSLGVVNVHISCGLGNGMGMLYNAYREGTPLLLTAGQQDRRLKFEEPILWSDLVSVARPWTKWSAEIDQVSDLPSAIRRAVQTALTPPTGPVFLSLPLDVQAADAGGLDLSPASTLDCRQRPPAEALRRAAALLLQAKNPAILTGSRVVEFAAVPELVAVAEKLGAPVISESGTTHGRLGFQPDHPLYAQGLPLWSPEVRQRLAEYDVLLVVGMDLLRQYLYHGPSRAIPEHVRLVQVDQDPWQIGKNYPVEVGIWGHLQEGLAELHALLQKQMTPEQADLAGRRAEVVKAANRQVQAELRGRVAEQRERRPLTPLTFMESLARTLPDDVAVIEEAVTTTNNYLERLGALRNTSGYFGHRGWALGWGLGTAIGVRLAWPDRPVLAILGDGAALYGIQGLWTAAHYRLPLTFVVANNAQYQILKVGSRGMHLPAAKEGRFVGLDLVDPEVDFVGLAQSLGVEAARVSEPDELSERVTRSLASDKPMLFEVPISRSFPGQLSY